MLKLNNTAKLRLLYNRVPYTRINKCLQSTISNSFSTKSSASVITIDRSNLPSYSRKQDTKTNEENVRNQQITDDLVSKLNPLALFIRSSVCDIILCIRS